MVKIRLKRIGKKKRPFYKIVAMDSRKKRDGIFIELIGYYDPIKKILKIDREKLAKWKSCGAQLTDVVEKLVKRPIEFPEVA